ncbi:MAG: acyl-homoserine-lactone synthase [Fimbriimonadaceae bacterium]
MLHLIDRRNRDQARPADLLEESYRLRHDVYVRDRGWKALERPDEREIDQFDTLDAVYFVWADDRRVLGGARFIPTHKPHLMSDVFPEIATIAPVPRSEDVWEITRFFSVRDPSGRITRNNVIGDILCGMFEMGLHHGLSGISVVCDTFFLPRFLEQDIRAIPLGLPTPYPEGICIACVMPVNHEQLCAARQARGVTEAVLFPEVGIAAKSNVRDYQRSSYAS